MKMLMVAILIAITPLLSSCAQELSMYDKMKLREQEFALPMHRDKFFAGDVSVYGPFTIEQIEERSFERIQKIAPDAPKVPFGYGQDQWEAFKEKIRSTDILYEYRTHSHAGSIAGGYGASGVVIVRDDMVVEVLAMSIY